jgi:thiol:disulfide interchange protein DsbC
MARTARDRILIRSVCAGALLAVIGCAASSTEPAGDPATRIRAALNERFPSVTIEQVNPVAQWTGLYEVVTSSEIVYTDASGNFLLGGSILDTRSKKNLTAERWSDLHRIDFNALPFDVAIKNVRGDGKRRLAVFADPECPYCKKLERELAPMTNVTIYTFLYPLESVHPGAREKAVKIWCAKDRARTWNDWMINGTAPESAACTGDPIASLLEFGGKLKINSTPTLFLPDGRRVNGAISLADLEQRLGDPSPAK